MYSLHSRQMILQEGDPLCLVLLLLACRRILGEIGDRLFPRLPKEVDEAAL